MKTRKKNRIDRLDDVDIYVDPRPMTKEDEAAISEFIRKHKAKTLSRSKRKRAA